MSDLHELEAQGVESNGSARVFDLRTRREIHVLPTHASMPETPASPARGDAGPAGMAQDPMTETILIVRIQHTKPLPEKVEDIAGQRIYGWLYSQGVEAGVRVVQDKGLEVWEQTK